MSTELHSVQTYPAAPSAVMAKYADRDFLQGRLEASSGLDPAVDEVTPGPNGELTVVVRQSIPASALPSMVASMMSGDPVTIRTEKWRPEGDGYAADFDVVIKGAPASLKGTMTLTPEEGTATGSTLTVDGSATVPIPLFGGKIEGVIVEHVEHLLQAEGDYTRSVL